MDVVRIRARIAEIAASPKNVRIEELVSLLDNHIGPLYANYNHHGSGHHAFTLGDQTFNVAHPHKTFVKPVYIKVFLRAMEALGLHIPDDESREKEDKGSR
jgi:hypothetical protein